MTYVALFVLSVTQIKKIEVTVEEHQSLRTEYAQALSDIEELEKVILSSESNLSSSQQQIEQQKQMLNKAEDATKTAKERAEKLASEKEELDQEVARLRGVGNWRTSALIAVEITWKKENSQDDDIDIYIQSPNKEITYFGSQIGQGLFIDRDDLGTAPISDTHSEVTQFFKLLKTDDPYLINLHAYSKTSTKPTPVTFRLYEISESEAKVVFEKEYIFTKLDQVEPVIEIFTKVFNNTNIYSHYTETKKVIDSIIFRANKARTPRPTTGTSLNAPLLNQRIIVRPEDIDPRFVIPPPIEKKK
jgi:DNA repair exonuclease SbcCD ATPase subunit